MSNLIVRSVESSDFNQWQILWKEYNRFYGRPSFPTKITVETWARFFDEHEPMHALVAERNGQLQGLAHYLFHRSTIRIELVCYLQDLFTLEAERGQGIGRALIETVYERASKANSQRVYWQTQENNMIARKLYDKIAKLSGFIVYYKEIESI